MCVTYRSSKLGVNLIVLAWHGQFYHDHPSVLAKINKTLLMKKSVRTLLWFREKSKFYFPESPVQGKKWCRGTVRLCPEGPDKCFVKKPQTT